MSCNLLNYSHFKVKLMGKLLQILRNFYPLDFLFFLICTHVIGNILLVKREKARVSFTFLTVPFGGRHSFFFLSEFEI